MGVNWHTGQLKGELSVIFSKTAVKWCDRSEMTDQPPSDTCSCFSCPVNDGEVGWFNHCMVNFLSSLPLILVLLLVLPWCLASTFESCHKRRRSQQQKTKQSQVFVFTV